MVLWGRMLSPEIRARLHNLNNLLTRVVSTADLLLDDIVEPGGLRADIEQIQQAGVRAADELLALKEHLDS